MNIKNMILAFLLAFIMVGCQSDEKKERRPPSATGPNAEILVVLEKGHWKGELGDSIRSVFEQFQYGLPQAEPMFDLVNLPPKGFKKIFHSHRHLFIVDITPKFKEPLVEAKRNVWSQPQMVVKISADEPKDVIEIIEKKEEDFLNYYLTNDKLRVINAFEGVRNQELINKLKKQFQLQMTIPTSFYIAKKAEDFAWIRKETKHLSQGILIHITNYEDTTVFSHKNIVELRNRYTKKYISGPKEGSYMTTDTIYPAKSKRISFNGHYAVETTGLWRTVEGSVMGGPFVRYTVLDEKRNRIVTVEGFVYAPKYDKRDYLRQMEAILQTLEFVEEEPQSSPKDKKSSTKATS